MFPDEFHAFPGSGVSGEAGPAPDLTPIIDVVVALLGTLMMLVGMQFVFGDVNLTELERGAAAAPPEEPPPVVLTLNRDGSVLWDGQPLAWSELPARLAAAGRAEPQTAQAGDAAAPADGSGRMLSGTPPVIIAGDREVSLGQAVELWSLVKSAGLTALMAAQPAGTEP